MIGTTFHGLGTPQTPSPPVPRSRARERGNATPRLCRSDEAKRGWRTCFLSVLKPWERGEADAGAERPRDGGGRRLQQWFNGEQTLALRLPGMYHSRRMWYDGMHTGTVTMNILHL